MYSLEDIKLGVLLTFTEAQAWARETITKGDKDTRLRRLSERTSPARTIFHTAEERRAAKRASNAAWRSRNQESERERHRRDGAKRKSRKGIAA
jgi:hypothetical protein